MPNYSELISDITAAIYPNSQQEIDALELRAVLTEMVQSLGAGFSFQGVADPAVNPGTPDNNVIYLAGPGTYTYYGALVVPAKSLGILKYDGSWSLETIDGVGGGGAELGNYVAVASVAELPVPGVATIGYLVGENLYLYVGTDGDTLDGKYQNCGPFRGPAGANGTSGADGKSAYQIWLDEGHAGSEEDFLASLQGNPGSSVDYPFTLVNNLTEGGVDKALTAEQGKVLNGRLDSYFGAQPVDTPMDLNSYPTSNFNLENASAWAANSTYKCIIIPATDFADADKLVFEPLTFKCSFAFLKSNNAAAGVAPDLCAGESVTTLAVGTPAAVKDIPSDCNYLYVYKSNQTTFTGKLSVSKRVEGVGEPLALLRQELVNEFGGAANEPLAASMADTMMNSLFGGVAARRKSDASIIRVLNGVESSSGNRLRVILPVSPGDTIVTSCPLGKGVAVSIYATYVDCYLCDTNYLQALVPYGTYSTGKVSGISAYSGYLVVSLCKADSSAFSDAEMAQYVDALLLSVSYSAVGELKNINEEIDKQKTHLFLGTLVQKGMTASGLTDNANRVSMASCCVVPKERATLSFALPIGWACGIRSGDTSANLSNNNYWYYNEDEFTFAAGVHYFRLCFAIPGTTSDKDKALSVAAVEAALAGGSVKVYVKDFPDDMIERNYESEKYVKAAMRNFVAGAANNGSLTKLPVFAHCSDFHGDAARFKDMMDYADYLGLDAAFATGDLVGTNPVDSMQYVNDLADSHITPALICMGNHDARGLSTAKAQNETIMGYLIDKYSLSTNPSETYPTYYYKDFSGKNIRVIALNLYETNHSNDQANVTQAQMNWFIATLASTPANYGVLVIFHSPESMPQKDNNYPSFYQDLANYTDMQVGMSGEPIQKIVDAFIGRNSVSVTYSSVTSGTITVSADFSSVNSGVEFIAYLNGHLHIDRIGYVPGTTHKQLNLNVCCGIAIYGTSIPYLANNSDMPRGCEGATQDCINIYAIDRSAKMVRIAKIGSNVSADMVGRKIMAIPYAD